MTKNFEYTKEDLQEFKELAEQGVPYGYAMLSRLYRMGYMPLMIEKDEKQALEYADAAFEAEKLYVAPECKDSDIRYCKGYGQYALGVFFEDIMGLEKTSFSFLEESAKMGNPYGQSSLGLCYLDGINVEQNEEIAVMYFKKAIEKGHVRAYSNLGVCYASGRGIKSNQDEAVKHFLEAAERGYALAQFNLGVYYASLSLSTGSEEDKKKATDLLHKAANQGYAQAQFNLGKYYYYGKGIKKDKKKAVEWYEKAAERGLAEAQYNLGMHYYYGRGIEENKKVGVNWFLKASNLGHELSQYCLGLHYGNNSSVKRSINCYAELLMNNEPRHYSFAKFYSKGNANNIFEVSKEYKYSDDDVVLITDKLIEGNRSISGVMLGSFVEDNTKKKSLLEKYHETLDERSSEECNEAEKIVINNLRLSGIKSYLEVGESEDCLALSLSKKYAEETYETQNFLLLGTINLFDHNECIAITVQKGEIASIDIFGSLRSFELDMASKQTLKKVIVKAFANDAFEENEYQEKLQINHWQPKITRKNSLSACSVFALDCINKITRGEIEELKNRDRKPFDIAEEMLVRKEHSNYFSSDRKRSSKTIHSETDSLLDASISESASLHDSAIKAIFDCLGFSEVDQAKLKIRQSRMLENFGKIMEDWLGSVPLTLKDLGLTFTGTKRTPELLEKRNIVKEKKLQYIEGIPIEARKITNDFPKSQLAEATLISTHYSQTALQTTPTLQKKKTEINFGTEALNSLTTLYKNLDKEEDRKKREQLLINYMSELKGIINTSCNVEVSGDEQKTLYERAKEERRIEMEILKREVKELFKLYDSVSRLSYELEPDSEEDAKQELDKLLIDIRKTLNEKRNTFNNKLAGYVDEVRQEKYFFAEMQMALGEKLEYLKDGALEIRKSEDVRNHTSERVATRVHNNAKDQMNRKSELEMRKFSDRAIEESLERLNDKIKMQGGKTILV